MESSANRIVTATLKLNSSNEEVIETVLANKTFTLDFTKEDQSYLRDFFKTCIEELLANKPFKFELITDPTVKNDVIIKVSEDYITSLNVELDNCLAEINKPEND